VWHDYGAALSTRGWRVIPIVPVDKAPGAWTGDRWFNPSGWQHAAVPSPAKIATYQSWPPCGIGIVLGAQGDASRSFVIAVDVDVYAPKLADEIEALAHTVLGSAPVRFGQRPKRLLLYRCSDAIGKLYTAKYSLPGDGAIAKGHRVEVLGTRKQCVVYGTHPCGQDYEWIDGSPASLAPCELPLVSRDTLQRFLVKSDRILLNAGGTVKSPFKPRQYPSRGSRRDANLPLRAGLFALLDATGRVLGRRGDRVDILCPFMDEHSDRADTGTALLAGGGIKCHHTTCDDVRKTEDFIAKLKDLAAEDGLDGTAIFDAAAHPKQLEIARAEFDEIDDATLANLRAKPRPTGNRSEYYRRVRHAAGTRRMAEAAQAAWQHKVKAARERLPT
jgi:hypothetical protein